MSDFLIPMDTMPEYLKSGNTEVNVGLVEGINAGAPPRIKLNGKAFVLIASDGTEKPVSIKRLQEGPDGQGYLPIIILVGKKSLVKSYYATGYNPNEEGRGPDCFSNDGVAPDKTVKIPMAASCAQCQYNAFGSGTDEKGNATGGKACSDVKLLAVFVVNEGVYGLRVPPASLKGFRTYIQDLASRNIPADRVITFLGFDAKASFPVLSFRFGGWVPQQSVESLEKLATSPEAMDAIAGFNASASAPALSPPEKKAELPPPEPKKEEKQSAKDAAPVQTQIAIDLGIPGMDTAPDKEAVKEVVPEIVAPEPQAPPVAVSTVTDNDLAAALGIPGL